MEDRAAEIAARAAAATATTGRIVYRGASTFGWDIEGPESGIRGQFEREEDAQFHAHAPGDVQWLLGANARLLARVSKLADALDLAAIDISTLLAVHGDDIQLTARCALDQRLAHIRAILAGGEQE